MIEPFGYFSLHTDFTMGIFVSQQPQNKLFFSLIHQNTCFAEDYHTAEVSGELGWLDVILLHHAERDLGVPLYGIHFMPFHGSMEVYLALSIHITDGDGIRITIVTMESQRTVRHPLEDAHTSFNRQ